MQGRVFTKNFQIEKRQHHLFVNLGHGFPRAAIVFGAFVFTINALVMFGIFRVVTKELIFLYVALPGVITMYGSRRVTGLPGRRVYTQWLIWAQYLVRGVMPILNLRDARGATRRARAAQARLIRRDLIETYAPAWGSDTDSPAEAPRPQPIDSGAPVRLRRTVTVHGSDYTAAAIMRLKRQ